mmetsp:Transcript_49980/g.112265  ORF Transcript_49980/g.112265 Transcript_49980/m.112265 type:complete len:294 (-) Transcript_49980:41-922(-)|eukprot:CAMPEP_0197924312 /NCGR_PEP_ID=MMETSP1439-20131203/95473_1 /TAXON_ID=66791 /ORGANISM="Gonyaulax spinifera, Strain CCMP409" /LENGTH=293 /DNA_ID=CAMNT_0043546729 /DNA_START=98 /DNA_END=979 /DNA_ORIENTATION=-
MSANVSVEFLDGEVLILPVSEADYVRDLLKRAQVAKPPPTSATLRLLSGEVLVKSQELATPLAGKTLNAVYGPKLSYLVPREGRVTLVDECDEGWDEAIAGESQVAQERWVPAPDADGLVELRNLAKEAEGVTLTATTKNYCNDDQKLLNLLRLGSTVGEPLYVPEGSTSLRGGTDGNPKLILDFGRVVMLQRVGATCSATNRWRDWFEAWSKADPADDDWESWGMDTAASHSPDEVFFLDRPPTRVRLLQIKATSGKVPGGRVRHLFAYGFDEPAATSGHSAVEPAPVPAEP